MATPESLVEATERSIKAATHLTDLDAGPVAALRALAVRVGTADPEKDNVTLPTYLKFCDALRLTPASRGVTVGESEAKGKLANLRSLRGGKNDAATGTG